MHTLAFIHAISFPLLASLSTGSKVPIPMDQSPLKTQNLSFCSAIMAGIQTLNADSTMNQTDLQKITKLFVSAFQPTLGPTLPHEKPLPKTYFRVMGPDNPRRLRQPTPSQQLFLTTEILKAGLSGEGILAVHVADDIEEMRWITSFPPKTETFLILNRAASLESKKLSRLIRYLHSSDHRLSIIWRDNPDTLPDSFVSLARVSGGSLWLPTEDPECNSLNQKM